MYTQMFHVWHIDSKIHANMTSLDPNGGFRLVRGTSNHSSHGCPWYWNNHGDLGICHFQNPHVVKKYRWIMDNNEKSDASWDIPCAWKMVCSKKHRVQTMFPFKCRSPLLPCLITGRSTSGDARRKVFIWFEKSPVESPKRIDCAKSPAFFSLKEMCPSGTIDSGKSWKHIGCSTREAGSMLLWPFFVRTSWQIMATSYVKPFEW